MRNEKGQFIKGSSGFTGKHSDETRRKIKEARARQGSNVWNKGTNLSGMKGKKHSEETKNRMALAQTGEKNHRWKGDDAGYVALHQWVYKQKGAPEECSVCHIVEKLEWSNISENYLREVDDWESLCHSCHMAKDNGGKPKSSAIKRKYGKFPNTI